MAAIPRLVSCDPWNWAGALLERMVELVKCRSQDEHVPADVEMVLEGTIDPNTARHPGVVLAGDAGYCSTAVAVPVMKVTAITHRANPLFPAVIQGPVPHEGTALGWLTERTLLAQLSELLPEVVDIALPAAGGCRSLAFVALRKQLPREGRRIAGALWALAPQVGTKLLVLVDAGVDVHNSEEVMSRVGNNVHPARDVFTQEMSAGLLEHASPAIGLGERLGIDATDKLPGEHPLDWPRPTRATDEVALLVSRRWQEYGFRPSDNSPG